MRDSRRGAALLIVIVIVALLSIMVVEFQRESRVEANYAMNSLYALEAQGLLRSGTAVGIAMMKSYSGQPTARADYWYNEAGHIIPVGGNAVLVTIDDEYSKFPIGALVDANGVPVQKVIDGYRRFLKALELDTEVEIDVLVWSLVDWLDNDATNDEFEFNNNFAVPDSVPEHVDEISRLIGYDELGPDNLKLITDEIDIRSDAKVNINTASIPVILAVGKNTTTGQAEQLYDYASDIPFDTIRHSMILANLPLADQAVSLTTQSGRLSMELEADVRGIRRRATVIIEEDPTTGVFDVVGWTQR